MNYRSLILKVLILTILCFLCLSHVVAARPGGQGI